jgi:hypothetical protein|eukprot:SAG25_NODE_228_length_11469_cov_7.729903_10_plen_32_part_00
MLAHPTLLYLRTRTCEGKAAVHWQLRVSILS